MKEALTRKDNYLVVYRIIAQLTRISLCIISLQMVIFLEELMKKRSLVREHFQFFTLNNSYWGKWNTTLGTDNSQRRLKMLLNHIFNSRKIMINYWRTSRYSSISHCPTFLEIMNPAPQRVRKWGWRSRLSHLPSSQRAGRLQFDHSFHTSCSTALFTKSFRK